MSRISIIKDEIDNDPLTRNYAGMDSVQAAADLNTEYRTRVRTSMTGDEIAQSVDSIEYGALTEGQKSLLLNFTSQESVDPKVGGFAQVVIVDLFGGGSTTVSNLSTNRVENISRATEIGAPNIKPGEIEEARRL